MDNKPTYEELEQKNKELEFRILELQKRAYPEESARALLAGMAHDLNNYVVPIAGLSEFILSQSDESSEIYKCAQSIKEAASDLRSFIVSMRKLYMGVDRHQLSGEVCSITDIIDSTLRNTEYVTDHNKINVFTEYSPDLKPINVNKSEMREVCANMILNAKDAMPQGGKLIIRAKNFYGKPTEKTKESQYILWEVEDTGEGISKDIIGRIFEPFFTTKNVKGTGLGLTICQGVVQRHGGDITVESELGVGTKFSIYLLAYTEANQ
jgi:two-component system cell cycle sensor histidine kinase/response regulator CckA